MKKNKNLKIFDFQKSKLKKIYYRKILNEKNFKYNDFFDRFFEIFCPNFFLEMFHRKKIFVVGVEFFFGYSFEPEKA